jgi:NADH-quinone oxidoreductase subunit E
MEDELEQKLCRKLLPLYKGERADLIPILQRVQAELGYLPAEAIRLIASFLNMTEGHVYSVASFYAQFRLAPLGKRRVRICRGTACHIRGATHILKETEKLLGIKEGDTTPDGEYSLETVACIGCCALAPCLRINRDVHGEMTQEKVRALFAPLNKGENDVQ